MEKLADTLSGIKNIFSRKQNSAEGASAECVELTEAANRTMGYEGHFVEGATPQAYA